MTQGAISTATVSDEHIEYGHVFANYVKSVADTPADPDPHPDIAVVNGQVSVTATFPGSAARGSLRLPGSPRSYGLIVTGDTFEIVNSKLVDHEGREGIWLVAAVDDVPLSWQAVVTLQDSAGRTIYNKSYIIHYDLWLETEDGLEIDLPDLIPTPSRLEPPEGAAVRLAERAIEEIKLLKGLIEISQTDAAESASFALTSRNQAQGFRNEAQGFRNEAEGFRDDAHTSAGEAGDSADAALASRNQAQGFRNEAEGFRDDAHTSAGEAGDSADAAAASRGAAKTSETNAAASKGAAKTSETNAKTSETNAAEHERRAGVERNFAEQVSTGVFARAVELEQDMGQFLEDWGAQFQSDYATLESLKGEMQNIATDVAIEVAKVDGVRDELNDALTVVRAHRWVPQGQWEYDLDYSAGDVVAHDGGSYYAQEDIPAGVEPPGGNWMVLGQGGITDAAELSGALTEYVDSSRTTIDLGSYVPGVEPELRAAQLVAILGHLYLSLESSVEASRVTGALTDQVDVSDAMVGLTLYIGGEVFNPVMPLSEFLTEMYGLYAATSSSLDHLANEYLNKSDVGHTHDGADITGALTDQVDASEAIVRVGSGQGSLESNLAWILQEISGKSATGHTHTWTQISDAPAYSKDATGDNLVQRSANGHINVPAGAGPQNAPRRSEVDAALSSKADKTYVDNRTPQVQRVTQLPASPDPNVQYWVVP